MLEVTNMGGSIINLGLVPNVGDFIVASIVSMKE